jgi:hypothetical protein
MGPLSARAAAVSKSAMKDLRAIGGMTGPSWIMNAAGTEMV